MAMTDHSDILSQREVKSSVQLTEQQHPESHELPSLDRQSSIFSLTPDEFHTFSGGIRSFGSMNMDELLNNIWTEEEIEAYAQTLFHNPSNTLSTAAPMDAATVTTVADTANINPQFPEGEISTLTVGDTAIQGLLRQGSLTLPSPLSQKTVDEMWYEIHQFHQEQEYGSNTNVQEVASAQRTAHGEMTLEDFLIKAGVVRGKDRAPSPLLQQPCVSYLNDNNTALGSGPPGYMARTDMASGGGGNVPANPALPERSVRDAASVAVGRIPNGYQPQEVRYCRKMQNNAGGGVYGQWSPASPVSPDSVEANQADSVNNLDRDIDVADRCSGPVVKVAARKQRQLIKNRESAARSRARKQAYTLQLEAELNKLKEENASLQQAMEEMEKKKQQYVEEFMKAHKAKDPKKGLKRSWSWIN